MRDAVIVAAVRTPVGKRDGGLAGVHPVDLSALVLKELVTRTGIDPALVGDVVWGCVTQSGEQSGNVGRYAALAAGFPESVAGVTVDRACGSSQQSLEFAAAAVIAGYRDVVIAGGVESMSRVPMGSARKAGPGKAFGPLVAGRYGVEGFNQGEGAEILAERWKLTRHDVDSYALESHARAAAAIDSGAFRDEIVPVGTFDTDEGVRRGGTLETLGGLKTVFREDGVVTAGNSSQISDGAAGLLIMTSSRARELGLRPLARIHSAAVAGVDPVSMLTGPIPATEKVLKSSGLTPADIGAYEVNEAFASVPLAWQAELGVDSARLNPLGGAIALGHPLGGSGARIATTLVHHLRAKGIRYGLQTMCEAGGMANATIFESL
ncbi:thiolase family protein [Amycolatopsis acidicola]|uniref:Thiolase family protein n=1 Tax=Amycolatopsis acidicola TaxID=2596893 RepID=A0A5N0UL74_9PSEU|nr:thiolase family protein [Amycolatopsis acidicola]KAA9150213.1 thiolase family protein [Amycolatopsis acidicola]